MSIIYHATSRCQWTEAKEKGYYKAPSLEVEGFIHCSQAHQLQGVLERYFKNKNDLVKLVIDTDKLSSSLQYELAPSINEVFPHVYGPINLDAVVNVEVI